MYGIKEDSVVLNDGTHLRTFNREITDANILEVEAGTTGYKGGDSGHGGRTYFRIKDLASTDMRVKTVTDCFGHTDELEVVLGGDTELSTIIKALKFITRVLEEESKEVHD